MSKIERFIWGGAGTFVIEVVRHFRLGAGEVIPTSNAVLFSVFLIICGGIFGIA